jgi:hypothetical protein
MQLNIFWVAFLTITVLFYRSKLAADTLDTSRLCRTVAATLAAEYKEHSAGHVHLQQGGRCIDPKFLDLLTDEEAQYCFW